MTKAQLKFGFTVPQGWRWLDVGQGNTAVKQYQFSTKVVQMAEAIGYNIEKLSVLPQPPVLDLIWNSISHIL